MHSRYFCRRELREDNLKSSFKGDDVGDVWKSVRRSRKSLKVDDLSKPSQTSEPHPKSKKNWKLSGFRSLSFDFWNIFDFAVVVVCYLPLGANMVAVIRLFRLLRVLKLVKALPELQVR